MSKITEIVNDECLDWWEDFFDNDGQIPVHDVSDENDTKFMNRPLKDRTKAYDRAMGVL